MKRSLFTLATITVLVVSAVSLHSHNTVAAMIQASQIKPTVQPTPHPDLKIRWLSSVTLDKTNTVGSSVGGDITGTVHLRRAAISTLTVNLSLEGALLDEAGILVALAPTSIKIPAGSDRATFRIQTLSSPNTPSPTTCRVRARYDDEQVSASFTVEPLKIASFNVVPAAGIGPFAATGTISLNARPLENKTVTLTSNNPLVRFGTMGNAQTSSSVTFNSTNNLRLFQVVAGAVSQPTTVTITARLGEQTLTRQIIVRPAI